MATGLADDELRLIATTARNLRITQMELCDVDDHLRESKLEEQVNQALLNVPMNDRQAFLDALSDMFPTWEETVVAAEPAPVEERDPAVLLQSLSKAGLASSDAQRREIIRRLGESWGIKNHAAQGVAKDVDEPAKAVALVKTRMGIATTETLDISRILEAFVLLCEFAQVLEALGNKVWRNVNPSATARSSPIQKILANHVKGGSGISASQELLELRGLLAAIIGAVPDICRHFHSDYLSRFAPDEIEEVVRLEGGSAFVGTETKCWRKYTKMASDLDEQRLKPQLSQVMISLIEPYLKNKPR